MTSNRAQRVRSLLKEPAQALSRHAEYHLRGHPGCSLSQSRCLVNKELRHIQRGERRSPQNVFRDIYAIERLHRWANRRAARRALRDALAYMRRENSRFTSRHGEAWFDARRGVAERLRTT